MAYASSERIMTVIGECCKVDAVVTLDSKGQILLPMDIRKRAKLKPNDKLAIVGYERNGELCCIMMVKAEKLGTAVSKVLSPMLRELRK